MTSFPVIIVGSVAGAADAPGEAPAPARAEVSEAGGAGYPWGLRDRLADREISILRRLVPIWDDDLEDGDLILSRLCRALEGERRSGKQGHWIYDINRHLALVRWVKKIRSMRDADRSS